jgi:hypothetical protein
MSHTIFDVLKLSDRRSSPAPARLRIRARAAEELVDMPAGPPLRPANPVQIAPIDRITSVARAAARLAARAPRGAALGWSLLVRPSEGEA